MKIDRQAVPGISAGFKFQWEASQKSYVLLYPEGMIQLNGPAGEIMSRIGGGKNTGEIIEELKAHFGDAEGIEADVLTFLKEAHEKRWITFGE